MVPTLKATCEKMIVLPSNTVVIEGWVSVDWITSCLKIKEIEHGLRLFVYPIIDTFNMPNAYDGTNGHPYYLKEQWQSIRDIFTSLGRYTR